MFELDLRVDELRKTPHPPQRGGRKDANWLRTETHVTVAQRSIRFRVR
jgi:hypothetical protein